MEYLEQQLEKAVDTAEANVHAQIADGGTSCHWCMEKSRKQAAREIVETLRSDKWAESELKDIIEKFGLEMRGMGRS